MAAVSMLACGKSCFHVKERKTQILPRIVRAAVGVKRQQLPLQTAGTVVPKAVAAGEPEIVGAEDTVREPCGHLQHQL